MVFQNVQVNLILVWSVFSLFNLTKTFDPDNLHIYLKYFFFCLNVSLIKNLNRQGEGVEIIYNVKMKVKRKEPSSVLHLER